MITLVKKIPAKYERIVLEEYYEFYQFQYGKKDFLNKNIKFTTNSDKLTDKEIDNKSLMDSIKTIKNEGDKFSFLLSFDTEGRLTSVTRIHISKEYIHICDIVYTNYPDVLEKLEILNEIIQKVEEIASLNNQQIDFEIPTNDEVTINFASSYGYALISSDKRVFRTLVFTKDIEKRDLDEQTLSRKQRKEFN